MTTQEVCVRLSDTPPKEDAEQGCGEMFLREVPVFHIGFVCTRPDGHRGPHVAHNCNGDERMRWDGVSQRRNY